MIAAGIKDSRVSAGLVSITNVEVAGDLQHCRIYVSIYGSAKARQDAMAGLDSAVGFVRGHLGRHLNMRRTPQLRFIEDKGLADGNSVLGTLARLAEERRRRSEIGPDNCGSGAAGEADDSNDSVA